MVIFLDINTFYSPKAGGIRTYHQAKIEWFRKHPGVGYYLVHPGPARRERNEAENVTLVEAFGPALTKDPSGYRLLIDFIHVFALIRRTRPDVLEAGDPWLTGVFCLLLRKLGLFKGLLVSFYHSDPVPSYFEPWAERGILKPLKRPLIKAAAALFYRLQRGYDLTVVASKTMEDRLRTKGVRAVAHLPFGVPAHFLADFPQRSYGLAPLPEAAVGPAPEARAMAGATTAYPDPASANGKIRLLYAGRLDPEKGIDLILHAVPEVLKQGNVYVTVAGRGSKTPWFAGFKHPRFAFLGFIDDAARMRGLYDEHDILLAPGPYETFGLGVLEAMARGMIVVGPDKGGTAELLRQAQSRFIFEADSLHDFLDTLERAIGCDRNAESERSRELSRRYGSWDDAIGRMISRYSARLGAKPS